MIFSKIFNRPYLSNGQAYVTVVVCGLSVVIVHNGCTLAKVYVVGENFLHEKFKLEHAKFQPYTPKNIFKLRVKWKR